jgi:hypothetical protein
VCLQKNFFFASEEDIAIHRISRVDGPWVLILSHLWWGRMYLLLGIHHTLVWNRVLQHGRGWLLQILLWGLLRGRRRWRTWCVHGFFHPFKVRNLGEMVSIMSMLTAKSAREVRPGGCCCCSSLGVCCYCPLGGSGYLDSGCPQQVGFVGGYFHLVPGYYCFSFFLSSWHYSTDGMDFPYSTVQKYEVVEWERDEQS